MPGRSIASWDSRRSGRTRTMTYKARHSPAYRRGGYGQVRYVKKHATRRRSRWSKPRRFR